MTISVSCFSTNFHLPCVSETDLPHSPPPRSTIRTRPGNSRCWPKFPVPFLSSLHPFTLVPSSTRMRLPLALVLLLSHSFALGARPAKRSYHTHDYYVLEHDPSAGASLEDCARALGVEVVEQAGELVDHWLVRIPKHVQRRDGVDVVSSTLETLRSLALERVPLSARSTSNLHARDLSSSIRWLGRQELRQRVKRAPPPIRPGQDSPNSVEAVSERLDIRDPSFPKQWHLINTPYPEHSMNVTGLWDLGYTGKGVISALVDDGLAYDHPDLADNFVRFS